MFVRWGTCLASPRSASLDFETCEVVLSSSLLGAVRHASLTSLTFCLAHPAPECALVVLQLKRALMRVGRGHVLNLADVPELEQIFNWHEQLYADALAPVSQIQGGAGGVWAVSAGPGACSMCGGQSLAACQCGDFASVLLHIIPAPVLLQ